jgi:hypothetical protein
MKIWDSGLAGFISSRNHKVIFGAAGLQPAPAQVENLCPHLHAKLIVKGIMAGSARPTGRPLARQ